MPWTVSPCKYGVLLFWLSTSAKIMTLAYARLSANNITIFGLSLFGDISDENPPCRNCDMMIEQTKKWAFTMNHCEEEC